MKKMLVLALTVFICSQAYADHNKRTSLTMGFMPYLASQQLIRKYQPLADYLSGEIGVDVEIVVAKDYATHLKNTGEDRLDISFLGGSPYVVITEKYGSKPLLARYEFNHRPHFRSVIFTTENSGLEEISDLKGKSVVYGSKKSTLSTQVPFFMLMQAGLSEDDYVSEFLNNHENVILSVLLGDFDAGAAAEEIFEEHKSKGLRAIAYSPYLSTHVFAASAELDPVLQDKIKKALLGLKDKVNGKEILTSVSPILTGFVDVRDSDYNLLRGILEQVLPVLEK